MPHDASVATPSPPTYDELLAENARLKRRIARLERRVAQLVRQVEKLRGEGHRQAAPFRKQDAPVAPAKQPGRKSGRRHGRHAHRPIPPRIDETYDASLPPECFCFLLRSCFAA